MFEIRQKEDFLVPFEKIGEPGWEENTRILLEAYADLWEEELPEPVTSEELAEVEEKLNTRLPDSLKLFYTTFGLPDIGEQLTPIEEIMWMKDIWKNNPYSPDFTKEDKKMLPYLVSFSDIRGNGNMFCFHSETQEVYYFDHEGVPHISKMFPKVDDYLKGCLVALQGQLPAEDIEIEDAELWMVEKLIELFDKQTIRKWMY